MAAPAYKIEELLHRNARTQAYRARARETGEKVIVRVPAPGQEPSALRREIEILELLGEQVSVIHPRRDAGLDVSTAVLTPDTGGVVLEPLLGANFELSLVTSLAKSLVQQIGRAHRVGVILKDVSPFNVSVDLSERRVHIISFGIASLVRGERSGLAHAENMESSLPYISPEQTGRMNREIDYRTDFYSLGVTLYQLVTGELPFASEDPLELVHAHIARAPAAPRRINPGLPLAFSELILKLLAKSADDRYQTCAGLIHDLDKIEAGQTEFELAIRDRPERFLIPQQLYGREAQLRQLVGAFEGVRAGPPQMVLVSGLSGIGKTALVHEIQRPTVVARGFFTTGKFDQLAQTVPYSGFIAAFRELVHQLLTESIASIAQWRQGFTTALGDQAQVLNELIPELGLIIGEQPEPVSVDATSAEKRMRMLLTRFVQVFTAGGRPLVIFMDDLQWADSASTKLLEQLAATSEIRSLLLLGAYRQEAVDESHALTRTIQRLREAEITLSEISLAPLDADAVLALVSDTLGEHSDRVQQLAALLREKTGGNPFFLREFFSAIHESGILGWMVGEQQWTWDLAAARGVEHTENVVDLMVAKLRKLPEATQRMLRTAACMGNLFELDPLARVTGNPVDQAREELWPAVQQGLIRSVGADEYSFAHDRIQEAADALLEPDQRPGVHLARGRLLWRDQDPDTLDERVFEICRHLNEALEQITDPGERHELAKIELGAGRRAKSSTAYDSACTYLRAGLELCSPAESSGAPATAWDLDYELAFALHRELAECEYLLGKFEAALHHFDRILGHAQTDLAKVEIFTLKAVLAYHSSNYPDGFTSTRAGLEILGVEIPAADDNEALTALGGEEGAKLGALLESRSIAELIDLPEMTDPEALAQAELLNELSMLGMFLNPALNGIGAIKRVRLSIEQGNSRVSAPAYASHGMIVGAVARDREAGFAFGKMALELAQRQADRRAECQAGFWFGTYICHWGAPLDESIPVLETGVEYGLRMGAPIWAAYNAFFVAVHTLIAGHRLDQVGDKLARYMPVLDPASHSGCVGYKQLVARLTGQHIEPRALFGDAEDEAGFIQKLDQPSLQLPLKHFFVAKLTELVFLGHTEEALALLDRAEGSGNIAVVLFGQVAVSWWTMLEGLTLCAALLAELGDEAGRQAWREQVAQCREHLADLAALAPMNYSELQLVLDAEWARCDARPDEAAELYERAINAARDNESPHIEGLANERAAAFHLALGSHAHAHAHIREASRRYASWGATAKVAQLAAEFPDAVGPNESENSGPGLVDPRAIDLGSVLKASRVLTSEIELDRLLETTLTLLLENAGADRGVLIIAVGEELWIEAAGHVEGQRAAIDTFADSPVALESGGDLPICVSVAQYVLRTRDTMVLDDAHTRGRMVRNSYITANVVRSVICTPLIHQGRLYGMVYLENNLVAGAFTPGRVETLKLLASHSVIAIQNARLYANLNRYSHELERVNKSMSRFVPSEFLGCLGKDSLLEVRLGQNVSKEMSILFSDIRGFTSLIEHLEESRHIDFINEYLQYMEPAVANNNGFVDSYIGDAIMALFEDSSRDAIQAAIDMSAELRELNGRRAARGELPVNMGVGINRGPLTLGTIGGPTRIKCGVIGQSVNLASRVQELTKRYRTFLLASDSAIRNLPTDSPYTSRVVGRVIVMGSEHPTTLHEIVDAEMCLPTRDAKLESLPTYELGVEAFFAACFDDAAAHFDRCLEACPQDTPAKLFRADCDYWKRMGISGRWTGVTRMDHKS